MPSSFQGLIAKEFERNKLLYKDCLGEALEEYAKLLLSENKKYNLTRITTPEDIVNKHFIDSILGFEKFLENQWSLPRLWPPYSHHSFPWIALGGKRSSKNSFHIMDVGSGAGFPGIPLVLYDQLCKDNQLIDKMDLLDSNRKKTEFLGLIKPKVARRVDRDLIEIHNSRLENLVLRENPPNLYVSRATGKISNVLNFFEQFIKKNLNDIEVKEGEICLLYYGGPDSVVLPEKEGRPFKLSSKVTCRLRRQARNVYKYQFSSSKYLRKNVLYVITNKITFDD